MAIKQSDWVLTCEKKESAIILPVNKPRENPPKSEGSCILTRKNTFNLDALSQERAPSSDCQCSGGGLREMGKPTNLEEQIKKKIIDLVDKEETLVDLYKKAADEAKQREQELREKTAVLMQQLEKDKNLMDILKSIK